MIMDTYYIRHTEHLNIDDATREKLWSERRIAIHFPQYKYGEDPKGKIPGGKPDNSSLDVDDYPSRARRAVRALVELAKTGGYVCAEYYGQQKSMLGFIDPDSQIELLRGKWGSPKHEGRQAILKTLRLKKVKLVNSSDFAVVFVGRPRQGTIMRWKRVGNVVENAVEGRQSKIELGHLFPDQQEIMCSEFLRSDSAEKIGLTKLAHLLLPVGRTMRGIDICGITVSGHLLFAQVTYKDIESCQKKIDDLFAYRDSQGSVLMLFCNCKEPKLMQGIQVIPLQLVYDTFVATPTGKLWVDRAGNISVQPC